MALEIDPEDITVRRFLVHVLLRQNRYDEAKAISLPDYTQMMRIFQESLTPLPADTAQASPP